MSSAEREIAVCQKLLGCRVLADGGFALAQAPLCAPLTACRYANRCRPLRPLRAELAAKVAPRLRRRQLPRAPFRWRRLGEGRAASAGSAATAPRAAEAASDSVPRQNGNAGAPTLARARAGRHIGATRRSRGRGARRTCHTNAPPPAPVASLQARRPQAAPARRHADDGFAFQRVRERNSGGTLGVDHENAQRCGTMRECPITAHRRALGTARDSTTQQRTHPATAAARSLSRGPRGLM